jgi:hypothetical protein
MSCQLHAECAMFEQTEKLSVDLILICISCVTEKVNNMKHMERDDSSFFQFHIYIIYVPKLFIVKETASVRRQCNVVIWRIALASVKRLSVGWTYLLSF